MVDATTSTSEDDEIDDDNEEADGAACLVSTANAVTANQTLIRWLPARTTIAELLDASESDCTQAPGASPAHVRVVYQRRVQTTWGTVSQGVVGRTLEEAFALENLVWTQNAAQKSLKLRIPKNAGKSLNDMAAALHKRVNGRHFKKTDFALALLTCDPAAWNVPYYIAEGLLWLENEVKPIDLSISGSEETPIFVISVNDPMPAPSAEV